MYIYKIHHYYDNADYSIYISGELDRDTTERLCALLILALETEKRDSGIEITNFGVANALIAHFGFEQAPHEHRDSIGIDLYDARQKYCGEFIAKHFEAMASEYGNTWLEAMHYLANHIEED